MKYDFILFENYHLATHHVFDVKLIAKMLTANRLKVAILDIYNEMECGAEDGIEILKMPILRQKPNDNWCKHPKGKLNSLFSLIRFLWQQHFYIEEVWQKVEPLADRFYCGSYSLFMSSIFLRSKKPCYYWGLRSARMADVITHFRKNPVLGVRMLLLRHRFMKNPVQGLFVSNEIIKEEFKNLGVDDNRMVIREERCIMEKGNPQYECLSDEVSFLTIGLLRPDKQIDYSVKEFSMCKCENSIFTLAGRSQGDYETVISESIAGKKNIFRINKFLDYKDFNSLITKSHFLILADKKQASCVTNGTMMEALINYRPIIAPNYNPYKHYIEKYDVGLVYNPDIKGDLAKTIEVAIENGCEFYRDKIEAFLRTIDFDFVSKKLYKQIYG